MPCHRYGVIEKTQTRPFKEKIWGYSQWRHQPARCQCTSHRRALFGERRGGWAARVKLGMERVPSGSFWKAHVIPFLVFFFKCFFFGWWSRHTANPYWKLTTHTSSTQYWGDREASGSEGRLLTNFAANMNFNRHSAAAAAFLQIPKLCRTLDLGLLDFIGFFSTFWYWEQKFCTEE